MASISLGENTEIKISLKVLVVLVAFVAGIGVWMARVEANQGSLEERMTAMEKRWTERDKKLEEQNKKVLDQTTLILKQLGVVEQ